MPGGINTDIGIHYVAFGAIKLIGYSLFTFRLNNIYEKELSIFKIGFTRLIIGVLFGSIFGYFFFHTGIYFYLGLIPIRLLEWSIISKLFYDNKLTNRTELIQTCIQGTVVSFLLDIPATIGFLVTGGFWVC